MLGGSLLTRGIKRGVGAPSKDGILKRAEPLSKEASGGELCQ